MNIQSIIFNRAHAYGFSRLYNNTFIDSEMPYGNVIQSDYIKNRLFNSKIYKTDCSCALLTQSDKLCGAAIANLRGTPFQEESDRLYLNMFIIDDAFRNKGLGQKLFDELVAVAQKNNIQSIKTSLQWCGIWPGIFSHWDKAILFCQKTGGTQKKGEIFLELDLFKEFQPIDFKTNLKKSIVLRQFKYKDIHSLSHFVQKFGAGWLHEVLNKVSGEYEFFNGYGLSSPYNPEDVFVAEHNNTICGFCIVQSNTKSDMAFFGPIGVQKNMRKHGIGASLLFKSIQYLKKKGNRRLGLWTNMDIFDTFYSQFGFQKTYETMHFEWHV